MRSSLGLSLVALGALQLVAVWAFALPRLMGASEPEAAPPVAPAPAEEPLATETVPSGPQDVLELDDLHRPW